VRAANKERASCA
jgi:hypothetical protein